MRSARRNRPRHMADILVGGRREATAMAEHAAHTGYWLGVCTVAGDEALSPKERQLKKTF